jgi:hypothetical protein
MRLIAAPERDVLCTLSTAPQARRSLHLRDTPDYHVEEDEGSRRTDDASGRLVCWSSNGRLFHHQVKLPGGFSFPGSVDGRIVAR